MEIKATLQKPYEENERMDFIVQYNHNQGYKINETETELQALGYTEAELAQQERERIAKLYLTGADVERGIYQAKGMDFDDIMAFVMANPPVGLDVKALRIELKANNFYRGNPYVSAIGGLLGFTSEQLDKFFETGDYTTLLPQSDKVEGESDKVSDIVTEQVTEPVEEQEPVVDDIPDGEDVNNLEE